MKAIDKAKITSWRSFCRVNEANPFGDVYRMYRSGFRREPMLDEAGQPLEEMSDECSHILSTHFRNDATIDLIPAALGEDIFRNIKAVATPLLQTFLVLH